MCFLSERKIDPHFPRSCGCCCSTTQGEMQLCPLNEVLSLFVPEKQLIVASTSILILYSTFITLDDPVMITMGSRLERCWFWGILPSRFVVYQGREHCIVTQVFIYGFKSPRMLPGVKSQHPVLQRLNPFSENLLVSFLSDRGLPEDMSAFLMEYATVLVCSRSRKLCARSSTSVL